jgi:hypothetical protein
MAEPWERIADIDAFRAVKRRARGVVVIRGSASTMIHHPDCPWVAEKGFLEKLGNDRLAYHWTTSVDAARARWPGAKVCRHPSEPLAGGTGGPEAGAATAAARTAPRSGTGWSVEGPSASLRAVRAESDFVVPFEPRSAEQRELRSELRERLRRLACREDEVLHASFFGTKPEHADVENLLLYNVDDSGAAFAGGTLGVRFEAAPPERRVGTRAFTFLYRPVPRTDGFKLWKAGETLATWPAVALDRPSERAAVWLAFRTATRAAHPGRHDGPFGVRVRLAGAGGAVALVKPLLDGIVAALQAHADRTTLPAVAARLAAAAGAAPADVERLLADASGATLGVVPRLVHLRGSGFQLAPADDRCVAAEVLVEPAADSGTASCEVVALTAR